MSQVITCYNCRNQLGVPPGVMQVGCPTCNVVNSLQPPTGYPGQQPQYPTGAQPQVMMTPMAQPAVVAVQVQVATPVRQHMTDVLQILGPQKSIMMRQKLDLLEAVSGWEQRNKYQVAAKPSGKGNSPEEWQDQAFVDALDKNHILSLKESSDCCERQFCRPNHTFRIKVKGGDDTTADGEGLGQFDRPFACTCWCPCFCTLFNPQTLTASLKGGQETGKTIQHCPCINNLVCCQRYWRVVDNTGKDKYLIHDYFCCNENMCAPSCCCPVRTINIKTPDESKVVGSIVNIWPGCNCRGCLGQFDNYILNFPEDATPTDKYNLLGALILVEYMVFEKKPDKNNNGGNVAGNVIGGLLG